MTLAPSLNILGSFFPAWLISIAERTNPETRVAWERAQQAAIAVVLAEGLYFPKLATAATGAIASTQLPIPKTVVPGGVFRACAKRIENLARTLEQSARAEAWTRAAAFAVSTGDLAQP